MSSQLRLRAEAQRDIEQAWSWYQGVSPEIGAAFLNELIKMFDRIEQFPEMYQTMHRTARRAVLLSFPYSVLYRVLPNAIEVLAVMQSQDLQHIQRHKRRPSPATDRRRNACQPASQ